MEDNASGHADESICNSSFSLIINKSVGNRFVIWQGRSNITVLSTLATLRSNLVHFFPFSGANSVTKACYLMKGPAMGSDGILTSVFIPHKISPGTNLMKNSQIRAEAKSEGTEAEIRFSFGLGFGRISHIFQLVLAWIETSRRGCDGCS